MEYGIPFLAAIAVAICNGLAAVLQKVSANKKRLVVTLNFGIILALLRNWPYLAGTILDVLAGGFTLLASHTLPLFLVQSLIATSIIFTAIFERVIFKKKITLKSLLAMIVVLIGLGMIAVATHSHQANIIGSAFKLILSISPLIVIVIGFWCLKTKTRSASFGLAALSGVCFGMTSVGGRILIYPDPVWHIVSNILAWIIVIYAILGLFFFTTALQRISATAVNSTMVGFQTIVPTAIGIIFLGDTARQGRWALVALGTVLVLIGCLYVTSSSQSKSV